MLCDLIYLDYKSCCGVLELLEFVEQVQRAAGKRELKQSSLEKTMIQARMWVIRNETYELQFC